MKNNTNINTEDGEVNLTKPSKEEYEASKKEQVYFSDCIRLSRQRQNELLDTLCEERSAEKMYMEIYEKHREIVRRYEIFEEIQRSH